MKRRAGRLARWLRLGRAGILAGGAFDTVAAAALGRWWLAGGVLALAAGGIAVAGAGLWLLRVLECLESPARSIGRVTPVPDGVEVLCDCAAVTVLDLRDVPVAGLPLERAFTCGGCQSVHWFTLAAVPGEAGAP